MESDPEYPVPCAWCGVRAASRIDPFCSSECEGKYEDWEYQTDE